MAVAERDEAFTAFVRLRGAALVRSAYLLCGDASRAEDLVQNALAATYVRWSSIRQVDNPEAYVRRAIVTANAGWWRRRSSSEIAVAAIPDTSVADRSDESADRHTLIPALRQLSPRQRAAVVLRYYDDLSEADTAALLGCSVGAVKRHTARGLDKLRTLLDPAGPVPPPIGEEALCL